MPCPTCSHTLHGVGEVPASGGRPIFWCPRCGTLVGTDDGLGTVNAEVPKLVERCREFEPIAFQTAESVWRSWNRLGIAESINVPEARPEAATR